MFLDDKEKEQALEETVELTVEPEVTEEEIVETSTKPLPKDEVKEIEEETSIKAEEIKEEVEETKEVKEAIETINEEAPELVESATEVVPSQEIEQPKVAPKKSSARDPKKKFNTNRKHIKRGRDTEFEERVIDIARVTKVVKGGRRFSFSALVVIGNQKGKVGWGHGKANEVPDAIKKAIKDAKTRLINVPIIDKRTIPHEIQSKFSASTILLKPAPKGKGVIASGAIRAVIELAGYKDIYSKLLSRSRSKTNSVKATYKALSELRTASDIAKIRGIKIESLLG